MPMADPRRRRRLFEVRKGDRMTPAERYVDARELAALMGVSTRTIKRMVAEGMPSETWGMSRTRRFLPSVAMAWARERRSRMLTNNHRPKPPQTATGRP
jgi:predicted DNA-binding transcriptional regulator AlpA